MNDWTPTNPALGVSGSTDGTEWSIVHNLTAKLIARFRTPEATQQFYDEIKGLAWDFSNPLKCPIGTWLGVRDALARRGVRLTPDWTLEVVDAC